MKEYYTVAELSNNEHMNERSGRVDSPETESARRHFLQRQQQVDHQQNWDNGSETGSDLQSRALFPSTPRTPVAGRNTGTNNYVTATKENRQAVRFSAKNFEELQRSIFTPTQFPIHGKMKPSSFEHDALTNSQVLNLIDDDEIDTEVLRSKRNFISTGPPSLSENPTFEEFNEWQTSMIDYLEFLPGYQDGMLKVRPNLDEISDDQLKRISERYDLIFKILTKATGKNKLVKLKTKSVDKLPVRDIVTWWAVVDEIFQPTETQIQQLRNSYIACVQKAQQSGTEFLHEVEAKAAELEKLGELYNDYEIGTKIYDGLRSPLKQLIWTNLMSQNIPCDLPTISKLIKAFDNMERSLVIDSELSRNMNANSAMMSNNKNFTSANNPSKRFKLNSNSNDQGSNSENSLKYFSKGASKGVPADRAKGMNKSSSEKTNKSEETGPLKTYEQIDADIIKNLDIDAAVKNMKKFRKMIRKIKNINGKDDKQGHHDKDEDNNSIEEEITDLTNDTKTARAKTTNYQRERSQFTPKVDNNGFRSLNSIERGNYRSTVTLEMITIRKLRQIPRKIFFVMILEIEEIIENQLLREM